MTGGFLPDNMEDCWMKMITKSIMKGGLSSFFIALTAVGLVGVFCESAIAASNETDVYLKLESFTWKEYLDSGEKILEESGPIYGLGISNQSEIGKSLIIGFKGELFGGSVDYDGQTQAGDPAQTDTDYLGYMIEGDFGVKAIDTEKFMLEPFAGLGFKWWVRDLKSNSTATGYEERWQSFYARLGIRCEERLSSPLKLFFGAGLKLPIYNENEVELSKFGLSDITLEPGNQNSFFADAGLKTDRFLARFFYESMKFSKSDPDDVYGVFYQPESEADIYGLNVGLRF
jgi:hypothetical protein